MGSIVDEGCLELDAAHALLGVLPSAATSSRSRGSGVVPFEPFQSSSADVVMTTSSSDADPHSDRCTIDDSDTSCSLIPNELSSQVVPVSSLSSAEKPPVNRPRSGSFGLDALADVATKETLAEASRSRILECSGKPSLVSSHASSDSSDGDSDAMPPPPPRRFGRQRSASNPEGMEKWGGGSLAFYNNNNRPMVTGRLHLVLPASILEEELAEVSAVMQRRAQNCDSSRTNYTHPLKQSIPEEEEEMAEDADDSAGTASEEKEDSCEDDEEEDDDEKLGPDELLQRARSRLLEDLLEGKLSGDKGVLILPHSLEKYKEIYNKDGRIGIYTPAERAAIIARFQRKRSRRVWNKKIRYNCRKSLADRRLRVKGRFVKRSEQEQLARDIMRTNNNQCEESDVLDEHMPDVNDPEAGFAPTADQPYRRLRRHTVT